MDQRINTNETEMQRRPNVYLPRGNQLSSAFFQIGAANAIEESEADKKQRQEQKEIDDLQKSEHELYNLGGFDEGFEDDFNLDTNHSDGPTTMHRSDSNDTASGLTISEDAVDQLSHRENNSPMVPMAMQRSPSSLQGPVGHQTLLNRANQVRQQTPERDPTPFSMPSFPLTLRRQNAIEPEQQVSY